MKNKKTRHPFKFLVAIFGICVGIIAAVVVGNQMISREVEKTRIQLESEVSAEKIHLDEDYVHYFEQYGIIYDGNMKVDEDYSTYRTICFENEEQSRTLYAFASNINYKRDKKFIPIDTRIKNTAGKEQQEKGYIYSVAGNDIATLFNKVLDMNKGVLVGDDELSFEILASKRNAEKVSYELRKNFIGIERAMVGYAGVVSKGTSTYFYPSNLGVNCEIVFSDNSTHKISFDLSVNTKGVKIRQEPGGYWVFEKRAENGKKIIVGVVQIPIIKDRHGNIVYSNDIDIRKQWGQNYTVELLLNEKTDLTDATAYISFETRKGNQSDNTLYSKLPDLQYTYLKNYSVIGQSENLGKGRMMLRFDSAKDFAFFSEAVISANFFIYNLTPNDLVKISAVKVLEDWCSLTGTWNNNYKTGKVVSTAIAGDDIINFDITEEFKAWCDDGTGDEQNNGVQLRTDEVDNNSLVLLSCDNTLFNNHTKIVFEKKAKSQDNN